MRYNLSMTNKKPLEDVAYCQNVDCKFRGKEWKSRMLTGVLGKLDYRIFVCPDCLKEIAEHGR
jgi:hypothetical protein